MAELVEERARVVQAQERGRARAALGEVVVVQDDRHLCGAVGRVAVLPAQVAHPRAAALGGPREVVLQEDALQAAVAVEDLVGLHIGVVDRDVGAGLETQAEEPFGAIEGGCDHAAKLEVRLDLGIVHRVARTAHLLCPETPVPRLDLAPGALGLHLLQQGLALALHGLQCTRPHLVQQVLHRGTGAGHGVGERVVGVAGVAVQAGLLAAQAQDVTHHLAVVVFTGVFAAAGPGTPGLLTKITPGAEGQERHHQRARERDHVASQAAVGRRLRGVGPHEVGQAGQRGFVGQRQRPAAFVVQHVLREARRQLRQLLHHLRVAGLGLGRQTGAGAHEVGVHAVEQALLLGAQAQGLAPLHAARPRGRRAPRRCRPYCGGRPSGRPSRAARPATPGWWPSC